MKQLASHNYRAVEVRLRNEEEPIIMNTAPGQRLMQHLTSGNTSAHVSLVDKDGNETVVKTTDITKVTPLKKLKDIKEFI